MKIAVYCSAKDTIPDDILSLGDDLGTWIAQQGHTLVYGGATGGLMTRVSNAAHKAGATVIGVVPTRIIQAHRMADNCDELYKTNSMSERKQLMRQIADVCVVLPGSYGTLDEMMDVWASGIVQEHSKPLLVLNYQGYYDDLIHLHHKMENLHFLPTTTQYVPIMADSLAQIEEWITNLKITKI